jgi:asparagine synthase (glutamine-hydrolysing)
LRPLVDDTLSTKSLRARGIFEPAAVARIIEANRAERIDSAYPLFALICIELWCRIFIDPPTPSLDWQQET